MSLLWWDARSKRNMRTGWNTSAWWDMRTRWNWVRMPRSFAPRSKARILIKVDIKKTLKRWAVKRMWGWEKSSSLFWFYLRRRNFWILII